MLTAPNIKVLLNYDPTLIPVILGCQNHFEIAIDGESIAPQRMTTPPTARQFKTLKPLILTFGRFRLSRHVYIRLSDPTTGTGDA